MTRRPPTGVPIDSAAQRWGAAFRLEMASQRMTQRRLVPLIGVRQPAISRWAVGARFPGLPVAVRVSEALMAPHLAELALELRTKACELCGAPFVDASAALHASVCGKRCRLSRDTEIHRRSELAAHMRNTKRIRLYQELVDRHCRDCEPSGICRTAACWLREVSPLPLARERVA